MKDREFVSVFRSSKKSDTYIYVRRGQNWDDLPEALRSIFGQPVHAMDLLLSPDKKTCQDHWQRSAGGIGREGFLSANAGRAGNLHC